MAGSIHAFASTELEDPEAPTRRRGSFRALLRSPAGVIGLVLTGFVLAVALLADFLAPYSPMVIGGPALLPPTEGAVIYVALSWGTLAGQAQRFLRVAWWLSVFPGLALVIAVLGFNLLADGLTDARRRR